MYEMYTARRENLYTFIIVFISEFEQIFTPRPVDFVPLPVEYYHFMDMNLLNIMKLCATVHIV